MRRKRVDVGGLFPIPEIPEHLAYSFEVPPWRV